MKQRKVTVHFHTPVEIDENTYYRVECITHTDFPGLYFRFSHYHENRRSRYASMIPLKNVADFQTAITQIFEKAKTLDKEGNP